MLINGAMLLQTVLGLAQQLWPTQQLTITDACTGHCLGALSPQQNLTSDNDGSSLTGNVKYRSLDCHANGQKGEINMQMSSKMYTFTCIQATTGVTNAKAIAVLQLGRPSELPEAEP